MNKDPTTPTWMPSKVHRLLISEVKPTIILMKNRKAPSPGEIPAKF